MNRLFWMTIIAVMLVCAPCFAQGQTFVVEPDNRYDGYSAVAIVWPTSMPDCTGKEYYEPKFTNLYGKMVNVAGERVQTEDECTWMYTSTGWAPALRRAGTKVAIDSQGRDLFDLGRADGLVCGNPRMTPKALVLLPPQAAEIRLVPPKLPPAPPVVLPELPPAPTFTVNSLPPEIGLPDRVDQPVVIVWENGRPLWSKFPVSNCVYQFGPGIKKHGVGDVIEKAGCGTGVALSIMSLTRGGTSAVAEFVSKPVPGTPGGASTPTGTPGVISPAANAVKTIVVSILK